MAIFRSQISCKLFRHIIYRNIKTRYNVFRKYANDVFDEYDFMVPKLPKSYYIRLFRKSPRSEAFPKRLLQRDDVLILRTRYASTLRLMLGASHFVALCATLVEQSSSARLQASLQTRSASIIRRR